MKNQPVYFGARHEAKKLADEFDVKLQKNSYQGLSYVVSLEVSEEVMKEAVKAYGFRTQWYDKTVESDSEGQYWEADLGFVKDCGSKWVYCYGVCFSDENVWHLHFSNCDEEPTARSADAYFVRDVLVEECLVDTSKWDDGDYYC